MNTLEASDPVGDPFARSEAVQMVRAAHARRKVNSWIPDMPRTWGEVGLFLDLENLAIGAARSLPGRDEPIPDEALTWLCRMHGATTIRRAYGDWTDRRFGRYVEILERHGITAVQVGHGATRKNNADICMAVDVIESLFTRPSIEAYVLVTGDSDFTPLVNKLREHGKHIVGVGAESTISTRLVAACTDYELWGDVVARVDRIHTSEPPPRRSPVRAISPTPAKTTADVPAPFTDVEQLVVAAFARITTTDTPTGSQLKSAILEIDPTFTLSHYGCTKLRDLLLRRLAHRVRQVARSGKDITIALIPVTSEPGKGTNEQ